MRLLFFGIIFFLGFGYSLGAGITLQDYKTYYSLLKKDIFFINNEKIDFYVNSFYPCDFYATENIVYIKPGCLLYGYLPTLDFKESIDLIWPLVKNFRSVYKLNSTGFYYFPAKPDFYTTYDINNVIGTGKTRKVLLSFLAGLDYWIKIPKIYLAFNQMKNYSFYVVSKNLEFRDKGRLQNFYVAAKALNDYILKPNKIININKLLANLPGYYKFSNKKYLFYGGVCGVSTMFFRLGLIVPYLYVLERYNHNYRYTKFYSNYIYGDDASLYEYQKVLKIKNIGKYPILFKYKNLNNKIFFVAIYPKNENYFSYVIKKQIGKLKSIVKAEKFDKYGRLFYSQQWISNYLGKR